MRRALRAALVLWALLLPVCHAAATPRRMPYDVSLCLSYATLSTAQQAVFDVLYDALAQGEEEIALPARTLYNDASLAMRTLLRDCPELCAVDGAFSLRYYRDTPQEAFGVAVSYTLPLEAQSLVMDAAKAAAAHEGTEADRAEALHDALCARVTYDLNAANPYSAYGALCEGRAVCEGYAEAMALVCRMSGIACSVVSGVCATEDGAAISHSWNMARLDGGCAWIDVTLDDQETLAHYYCGLTDAELLRDHAPDESRNGLPACDAPGLNWYARHGLLAPQGENALRQFMYAQFSALWTYNSARPVRFATDEDCQWALERLESLLLDWQRENPDAVAGERYALIAVPAQRCLTLIP